MSAKPTYEELEARIQALEHSETELKQARETLKKSETTLKSIFRAAPTGIGIVADRVFMEVNERFCEITGYSRDELIKKNAKMLYPTEDEFQYVGREKYRQIREQGTGTVETRFQRKDGHVIDVLLSSTPLDPEDLAAGVTFSALDITQRKTAEEALRQSEKRWQDIIKNAAIGIYQVTDQGIFEMVNPRLAKIFGYEAPDEFLTRVENISQLYLRPEERAPILQEMRKNGYVDGAEVQFKRKDGKTIWIRINARIIRDTPAKFIYEGFMADITDVKQAQYALRESEERLRNIVEHSSNLFYSHTAEHQLTYLSPQCREFLQCEPEEAMIRWTDFATDNPINEKGVERTVTAIRTGKRQPPYELELKGKYGRIISVEVRETPILADGKTTDIIGSLTDITERKQAEEALRESEIKLRTILEANPDPIVLYDNNGHPRYLNPAFTGLFGWSLDELEGGVIPFVPEDQKKITQDKIKEVFNSREAGRIETQRLTKDGRIIDVVVSGATIKGADETPTGLVSCLTDISKIRELQEQVRQSHKMEAIGTLAGGIAHEFNNILGIILGNTELAIDDVPQWNPAADCLQEIRTASLRARDVVKRILSFARKMPSEKKLIIISTTVKESIKLLRATIPATIEIRQQIACESEMIRADQTEIHQVLMNLCANSAHAMSEKSGILEIGLKSVHLDRFDAASYEGLKPGRHVRMRVQDNGMGIPSNIMDRILDPYFTTKQVDEGLGMGLAIVYGLVKKNEGAIRIQSKIGEGTRVEVMFPLIQDRSQIKAREPEKLPKGMERILVVDDETALVKMETRLLERLGYTVLGMNSSTGALAVFQKKPEQFDLVITDMAMPKMAGDELAGEIIKIRPDIPVILCTGHSENVDKKRAVEAGVAGFYKKPIDKKQLAEIVRRVLDRESNDNT